MTSLTQRVAGLERGLAVSALDRLLSRHAGRWAYIVVETLAGALRGRSARREQTQMLTRSVARLELQHDQLFAILRAARAKGHHGGRKPALSAEQARQARRMVADGTEVATVARVLGVCRPVIYRVATGSNGYGSE